MQEVTSENGEEETFEFDCPDCGAHVTGDALRCPGCGVEFVIEEVTEYEGEEETFEVVEDDVDVEEATEAGDAVDIEETIEVEDADEVQEVDPEALKKEFATLTEELRPLLELAERHGADTSGSRRLMDKAVSAGKRREVEEAVTLLRECRSSLDQEIDDRLENDLCHLEDLVDAAEAAGSDATDLRTIIGTARSLKEGGDREGALQEAEEGERMAERLSGRYLDANTMYEALERAVLNSELFYLDVREVRALLDEAMEAKERADWTTMGILSRKGRDELARVLPESINAELRRAKQSLLDAKASGRDVTLMVKLLKAAGAEAKRGRSEEALERLVEFRQEEEAS